MIDFHCHILPGLDDGALSIDESIAMAKALADFGYTTVCCTPHCIKGYYELTPLKVREAVLMLQADLDNAGICLELRPGMEYTLDECFAGYADDLLPLGETRLVLCEAPQRAHPGIVREGLEAILAKGFVPLIAHPERTQYFYEHPLVAGLWPEGHDGKAMPAGPAPQKTGFFSKIFRKSLTPPATSHESSNANTMLPGGVAFHANLGSFTGYYGETVQRKAYEFLKLGVYKALASDLHNAASAPLVLVRDKFVTNPLLKKLAEFDGSIPSLSAPGDGRGGQGELF